MRVIENTSTEYQIPAIQGSVKQKVTFSFYTTVTWKLPTPQKPLLAVGRGFFCRLSVANKKILSMCLRTCPLA